MRDAHLHLADERLFPEADRIMEQLRALGVSRLVVNGTGPEDWGRVADLARRFPEVWPSFGLHPWRVNEVAAGWREELQGWLDEFPGAGLGEIGLDRWIEGYDLPKQKQVFLEQLALADQVAGPISVHVLRAWGALIECLDAWPKPRPFLLHSYGGSRELVRELVERGAWFSLSGYFFRPDKAAKLEVFREVPEDRLLLESDAPDMLPPDTLRIAQCQDPDLNHPANIAAIYTAYAHWRGIDLPEATRRINENFDRWTGGG